MFSVGAIIMSAAVAFKRSYDGGKATLDQFTHLFIGRKVHNLSLERPSSDTFYIKLLSKKYQVIEMH